MSTQQNSFPGKGAWERKFRFLRDYDMEHMFLMLLSMATSVHQLRYMHNQLPENCRLLRDDVIQLEDFWQQYLSERPTSGVVNSFGDASADKWLLEQSRQGSDLVEYYRKVLHNHGAELGVSYGRTWILPDDHLASDFMSTLFGMTVRVRCSVYSDGDTAESNTLTIWLNLLPDSVLTEGLTHQLLTKLPSYGVEIASKRPCETNFFYSTPAGKNQTSCHDGKFKTIWTEGIMTGLTSDWSTRISESYRANPVFLSRLAERCREIGIPIEGDIVTRK